MLGTDAAAVAFGFYLCRAPWDLERRNDVLMVGFEPPVSAGSGELFEAMKAEVGQGARVVAFPRAMPQVSQTGMPVFKELVRFLIGNGVEVQRGIQVPLVPSRITAVARNGERGVSIENTHSWGCSQNSLSLVGGGG